MEEGWGSNAKKPWTNVQGSFQTGEFLGYYDLTLTATRTWNDIGQIEFRCKFTSKKMEKHRES
jgi:hypothetical protein